MRRTYFRKFYSAYRATQSAASVSSSVQLSRSVSGRLLCPSISLSSCLGGTVGEGRSVFSPRSRSSVSGCVHAFTVHTNRKVQTADRAYAAAFPWVPRELRGRLASRLIVQRMASRLGCSVCHSHPIACLVLSGSKVEGMYSRLFFATGHHRWLWLRDYRATRSTMFSMSSTLSLTPYYLARFLCGRS